MPTHVTWIDRLRIERVVWTLDQQLYDLPRSSRIEKRRETRQNLLSASRDIGATEALRRLGSTGRLADEYLTGELGTRRHSWLAAALFFATVPLVLTSLLTETANAYRDGILAVDPSVTGTFTWHGIDHLQSNVTYTFDNGASSSVGGEWITQPAVWVILIAGAILIGRLWRALPAWRRRQYGHVSSAD
jgi:hypothetical protein